MILSGVMMLRYLGEMDAAEKLDNAVASIIKEGRDVTYDMKPVPDDPTAATTSGVADAIIAKMAI
jgi:isocitrate dehydrogenase (NAD+)